jgi:hypothetical protein
MKATLLAMVLLITWNCSIAQTQNDACTLITTDQINQLLGCKVGDGKAMMAGKYCEHHSTDFKIKVLIQYTGYSSAKMAGDMLKMAYDENSKAITQGQKAVGIYNTVKLFDAAGPMTYYMTSPGNEYSPGQLVRLQFVLGNAMLTVDTTGIDMDKVIAKLAEIYKIIKGNYKI